MLQFRQNDTEAILLLTLKENVTINEPYYLFVFTHVLTKEKVLLVKHESEDESNNQGRINQFTINASVVFASKPVGEYHYKVYEKTTSSADESTAGNILEYGKLMLLRDTDFSFTQYNNSTSYKAYNG